MGLDYVYLSHMDTKFCVMQAHKIAVSWRRNA